MHFYNAAMTTLLPLALTTKLQNASSESITLSAEERKSLVEAITKRSFISLTLKYSRFGSVEIPDVALTAVTVNALREQATFKWNQLRENDFSIFSNERHTHEISDNYLQNAKYPRTFYIKTKQIGFSEFSESEALNYAGVKEILDVEIDDSRFPQPVSIPDNHPLLLHTVKELELKHKLYNPLEKGCEYTRREFISSVLVLAASIAEVKMACEETVNGSLGYGPVDWMAHCQNHRICITEGKKDNATQGLHQNLAQLAAAAEGRGQKRQFCVDLPLYGVATTYREWIFLRLDPKNARTKEDGAIRLPTYTIDDLFGLEKGVQRAASRLAGILQGQKKLVDKATGKEHAKKSRSNETKTCVSEDLLNAS